MIAHPREIFRLALASAAYGVAVMDNYPIGDSSPSDADIRITRDLIRAGQLLKVEVLDHEIVCNGNLTSFKSLEHFHR